MKAKIENFLKVAYFNAQSIRNKMHIFRAMIASEDLDIVGITETWINEETRDFIGEYEIAGYKIFKKDRTCKKGGGVLLYVKNTLNPVKYDINTMHELIGIKINSTSRSMHIFLVYRPPHQPQISDDSLYRELSLAINNKLSLILGDFNAVVDWNTRTSESHQEGARLLEFVNDEFLHQWVDKPTRGNNTLDLVLSTEDNLISNLTIGEKLGKSDHSIVRFHINLSYQATKKTIQKLDFRRADFNQLKEKVRNLNYVHSGNFDNIWTSFIDAYKEMRTTCIPYRQTSSNGTLQPKWFNREIANKIKERNRIHKLLTVHNTQKERQLIGNYVGK